MPRYYFHVFDSLAMFDEEGTDLPGIRAAQAEALHVAQELIGVTGSKAEFQSDWRIEVVDEAGSLVFRLEFMVPIAISDRAARP